MAQVQFFKIPKQDKNNGQESFDQQRGEKKNTLFSICFPKKMTSKIHSLKIFTSFQFCFFWGEKNSIYCRYLKDEPVNELKVVLNFWTPSSSSSSRSLYVIPLTFIPLLCWFFCQLSSIW